MPWASLKAMDSKSSSERLFANLSYLFHRSLASTRDIKLLRDRVQMDYDHGAILDELLQGDLAFLCQGFRV